jgi:hypothetical protein
MLALVPLGMAIHSLAGAESATSQLTSEAEVITESDARQLAHRVRAAVVKRSRERVTIRMQHIAPSVPTVRREQPEPTGAAVGSAPEKPVGSTATATARHRKRIAAQKRSASRRRAKKMERSQKSAPAPFPEDDVADQLLGDANRLAKQKRESAGPAHRAGAQGAGSGPAGAAPIHASPEQVRTGSGAGTRKAWRPESGKARPGAGMGRESGAAGHHGRGKRR